jgi:hypothetical protein
MKLRLFARACTVLIATVAIAPLAGAWGTIGHDMQARVAVQQLPADFPSFFRAAGEELSFLISEPDRWSTSEQPGLFDSTTVNHIFKWEIAPRLLPPTRHAFFAQLSEGKNPTQAAAAIRNIGTAPYGIKEWGEMLTGAFRRWREMPEGTPAEKTRRRMHERSILFMAGVLGHWITDLSQPMHTSIHVTSWHASAPNPQGYSGRGLHSRFETNYVDRVIRTEDIAARVEPQPRLLGDWLRESETYIAANNTHVEQIYRWDKDAPFGDGNEPAAAKPFTAARLAEGAQMLRDAWHTAWVRSQAPLPKFEAARPDSPKNR